MERFNSGELKRIFRNISRTVLIGLTIDGKHVQQQEEEYNGDSSTVLMIQEHLFISELFKVIQDATLSISLFRTMLLFRATFFQYKYRQFGIDVWRSNFEQKTYSILSACGSMDKTLRILIRPTWIKRVMHNTCIKHGRDIRTQNIGSTSILLWGNDWSSIRLDQTLSNAIILHQTLPAYCILKVVRMDTGDVFYEKVNMSLRPPPKISLKNDCKRELGSEDALRPEGQVVQLLRSVQSNQPIANRSRDRTGQPVVKYDRTGQPVVETGRTQTRSSDDNKSVNAEIARDRNEQPVVKTHSKCARWLPNTSLSWKHKLQRGRRNSSWLNGAISCQPWRIKSWATNA